MYTLLFVKLARFPWNYTTLNREFTMETKEGGGLQEKEFTTEKV